MDRVITRDATRLGSGQVYYTPWCDEHGKVIDDGTVSRLDDDSYRWTAADPQVRWLRLNARGLDVTIEDVTQQVASLALQGPLSAGCAGGRNGRIVRGPALLPAARRPHRRHRRSTSAGRAIPATWATSCGSRRPSAGLWDALMAAGRAFALRPAGMLALDVVRVEAGLILLEVDYTSSMHALIPEQSYSPAEIGLGRLVALDKATPFVGQAALRREAAAGGPGRRLVGLTLDWVDLERLYAAQDLTPALSSTAWRQQVPGLSRRPPGGPCDEWHLEPGAQAEHRSGASVEARYEPVGTTLEMEWTVEGRRGRVGATVVAVAVLRSAAEARLTHACHVPLPHRTLVPVPAAGLGRSRGPPGGGRRTRPDS